MNRKAAYILGVAAGSFALGYGIKSKIATLCDGEPTEITPNIEVEPKKTEDKVITHINHNQTVFTYDLQNPSIALAVIKARDLVYRLKDEVGTPGLVIAVSIDGKTVWTEGFGLADVENRVPCYPDTVMRIASISKSITMAVVARHWQEGKLNLDKPVQHYVPTFPKKVFEKEEVTITTRQLVSHLAGIRHYKKENEEENKNKKNNKKNKNAKTREGDSRYLEFYIKDKFSTVEDSLKLFRDDELLFKPGTSFKYTTHGWTLVSAVVEAVAKEPFTKVMQNFFQVMGLQQTYLDEAEPLIYYRARFYDKDSRGRLKNVPYVDTSYKWAGGGLLSTVGDLLRFGNAMLYCYQWQPELDSKLYPPGYLQANTVKSMWTPLPGTSMKWGREDGYGMGWVVLPERQEFGGGDLQKFAVGHTGGAVGASSVLLVVPMPVRYPSEDTLEISDAYVVIPSGITVAIIVNLQDVGLSRLASNVAALFCKAINS